MRIQIQNHVVPQILEVSGSRIAGSFGAQANFRPWLSWRCTGWALIQPAESPGHTVLIQSQITHRKSSSSLTSTTQFQSLAGS